MHLIHSADQESFKCNVFQSCHPQNAQSIKGETKCTDTQLNSCLSAESWQLGVKIDNLSSLIKT